MQTATEIWAKELVECIHFLHQKGFAPATSSNYSFRLPESPTINISASGMDKGSFSVADLMEVDLQGISLDDLRKPSAETLLHTLIYEQQPDVGCVLHTHTIYNTVLSSIFEKQGHLVLEGFEVLKGLSGIRTHESKVAVPIFVNSQDMRALAATVKGYWESHPEMHGFLLSGHGLYSWGSTIAEAKRHIEVFEFLFECYYKIHTFSINQNLIANGHSTHTGSR